ncbi:MAG TPA: hypothetical protein VN756_11480 [Solirubrobacterales bacterium]|nr:hypothetical protein [Solirubrobacterales bacterium]
MDAFSSLEREAVRGTGGDVDDEIGLTPALVLVAVDQKGNPGDFAQLYVVRPRR